MADIRTIKVVVDGTQAQADIARVEAELRRLTSAYGGLSEEVRRASADVDELTNSLQNSNSNETTNQLDRTSDSMRRVGDQAETARGKLSEFVRDKASDGIRGLADNVEGASLAFELMSKVGGRAGLALGAVGVAVGIVATAFVQGRREAGELNRALAMTSNAAGLTQTSFEDMARVVSRDTGKSFSDAREAMLEFVSSGQFTGDEIEKLARIAVKTSTATGKSVKESADMFKDLMNAPLETAKTVDRATNFMSASALEMVGRLDQQGRKVDAAKLVLQEYDRYVSGASAKAKKDDIELWKQLTNAVSDYWSEFKIALNPQSASRSRQLADLDAQIAATEKLQKRGPASLTNPLGITSDGERRLVELKASAAKIRAEIKAESDAANQQAQSARIQLEGKQAYDFLRPYMDRSDAEKEKDYWNAVKKAREAQAEAMKADPNLKADPMLSDEAVNKGFQAFKEANKNPIDERNVKQAYEKSLVQYDAYIERGHTLRELNENLLQNAYAVELFTTSEFIDRQKELQDEDLAQEEYYVRKKRDAAARVRQMYPDDDEANEKLAELEEELKGFERRREIANAQYTGRVEAQAKAISTSQRQLNEQMAEYRKARDEGMEGELAGMFSSNRQAEVTAGMNAINARNRQMVQAAKDQYRGLTGVADSDEERTALREIEAARREDIIAFEQHLAKRDALQADWKVGALKGLEDYADEMQNVAQLTNNAITGILGSMEDHLANFFATGKFGFKEFVTEINNQLARIAASQVTGLFAQAVGGFFGAKADGGDVLAGSSYLVGERGPEVFRPGISGSIVPNHMLTTNNSTASNTYAPSISLNLNVSGQGFSPNQAEALGNHVSNQVMTRVMDELRYNGMLSGRGR